MKKQNKNKIIIVIISVILLLFLFFLPNLSKKQKPGISVMLFDKDGNEITPRQSFAIVGPDGGLGTPDVASIRLKVTVHNTGSEPLTCGLKGRGGLLTNSLSPPNYFNDAMTDTDERSLVSDAYASWITGTIDADTIASDTDIQGASGLITFNAQVNCSDVFGEISVPTAHLTLKIVPDGTPSGTASVTVTQVEGTEDLFCGDGTCSSEIGESSSNCPTDCTPVIQQVNFRTSDLNYGSSSSIGYTSSCGNSLTIYGRNSVSSSTSYTCDHLASSSEVKCGGGTVSKIMNVPGTINGYAQPLGLYKGTSDNSKACICATDDDGVGYKFMYYSTSINGDSLSDQSDSLENGQQTTEVNC